jgi:hypothetical protein
MAWYSTGREGRTSVIRVNLSSTPSPPAPLPPGERGARRKRYRNGILEMLWKRLYVMVPLLLCNKSEASSVLPPLRRGERGGWEKGLGDEGEKLASYLIDIDALRFANASVTKSLLKSTHCWYF